MATVTERVGVLETKVQHIDAKIDDLKADIKDMHDCLDKTRDTIESTLGAMRLESTGQHTELAAKIADMEKSKDKAIRYGAIAIAFIAGAGWSGAINFPMIIKFFGI